MAVPNRPGSGSNEARREAKRDVAKDNYRDNRPERIKDVTKKTMQNINNSNNDYDVTDGSDMLSDEFLNSLLED